MLNMMFLIFMNIDVLSSKIIISARIIRTIGAVGCWILWVKVFYWMRLFKATAHFITLIFTTIYDVRVFTLMLCIIIIAFANFFFVVNLNTNQGVATTTTSHDGYYYVPDYTLPKPLNALMSTYMMSLGEFDYGGYGIGPDIYIVWIFFVLGTFLMLVVFMNMLIAIMSDTFSTVLAIKDENALKEQANLIDDFIWLVDLTKEFHGKKHIIVLTPDVSINQQQEDLGNEINLLGMQLSKKTDSSLTTMQKRMDAFEKNNRMMHKTGQANLMKIKKMLFDMKAEQKKKEAEHKKKEEEEAKEKADKEDDKENKDEDDE